MSKIYSTKINREIICDTFILGGGLAGSSAAISSARGGLDTVLAEIGGSLGGQAGIGMVTPLSADRDRNGKSFGGLVREIVAKATEKTEKYMKTEDEIGKHSSLSPRMTSLTLLEMAKDAGVKLHFYTFLADVITKDKSIDSVILLDKNGFLKVKAKYYIDASGDADMIARSGDKAVLGSEPGVYEQLSEKNLDKVHESDIVINGDYDHAGLMQPVSLFFIMRGVDYEEAAKLNNKKLFFGDLGITKEKFEAWKHAGSEGFEITSDAIPTPQGRILVTRGRHADEAVINMSRIIGINGADADSLSDGETRAFLQLIAIVDFLKTFVPPFKNSYLTEISGRLGVRESRRLVGKYVLSGKEVISCVPFEDTLCLGNYIVDIHDPLGKNKAIGGQIERDFFHVPFRSVCSAKYDNLMAAGRCVSCDHIAASAVRIQGTCILTGQGAGLACVAAKSAGAPPCSLDYALLKKELDKNGVRTE